MPLCGDRALDKPLDSSSLSRSVSAAIPLQQLSPHVIVSLLVSHVELLFLFRLHYFLRCHFVPNLLQVSELGCFLDSALSRGVVRRQLGVRRVCGRVTGTRGAPSAHVVLVGG